MQLSANYGLYLPEGTDNVKRQNFVDNFTKIDTEMKTINDNGYPNVTATGTNAYAGSTDKIKSLGKGTKLTLFIGVDATGNCTLNLNSYGAKNIKDSFGNIVTNLKKDVPYNLCYNGTDFILQGKGGGGNATADQILVGKKVTVDSGSIVGTMPNLTGVRNATGVAKWGDGGLAVYPEKGYQKGGSGDGEVKVSVAQLQSAEPALISTNIISGKSIFGVGGSASVSSLGGKQFASGVTTSGTTETDISSIVNSVYMLTAAGLTFKPILILAKHYIDTSACTGYTLYEESTGEPAYVGTRTCKMNHSSASGGSYAEYEIDASSSAISILSTGFTIPVWESGVAYNWIALG